MREHFFRGEALGVVVVKNLSKQVGKQHCVFFFDGRGIFLLEFLKCLITPPPLSSIVYHTSAVVI